MAAREDERVANRNLIATDRGVDRGDQLGPGRLVVNALSGFEGRRGQRRAAQAARSNTPPRVRIASRGPAGVANQQGASPGVTTAAQRRRARRGGG